MIALNGGALLSPVFAGCCSLEQFGYSDERTKSKQPDRAAAAGLSDLSSKFLSVVTAFRRSHCIACAHDPRRNSESTMCSPYGRSPFPISFTASVSEGLANTALTSQIPPYGPVLS